MASESANTASDDEVNLLPDGGKAERSDLVDGRVWRRVNSVVSSDSSGGPVLRTTVKPVKRFRPESSSGMCLFTGILLPSYRPPGSCNFLFCSLTTRPTMFLFC